MVVKYARVAMKRRGGGAGRAETVRVKASEDTRREIENVR